MNSSLFLALDTATDVPSLAVGSPDAPGEDVRLASRRDLSRDIEHATAALLARRGVGLGDVAGVVVADGPGSFTGLRIGIAFAKGVCRARGLPLLTAPSMLGAACAAAGGAGTVLVEYDALRGDVYRAVYRFGPAVPGAGLSAAGALEVLDPPALVPRIAPPPAHARLVRADAANASAGALIRLHGLGALVTVEAPDSWEPSYGRLAEAEVRRRAAER